MIGEVAIGCRLILVRLMLIRTKARWDDCARTASLSALPECTNVSGLDIKQACFHDASASQPPQEARQTQHQFAFDRRLSVVVSDNGRFKPSVIFSIFQRA